MKIRTRFLISFAVIYLLTLITVIAEVMLDETALVRIVMLTILFLCVLACAAWNIRAVHASIDKLKTATKRITSGDLDFTLESEEDDEFGELMTDFEVMRSRLAEAEREKERYDKESRELISNISHDLKTPITTVKGYIEGIMDGVADTPEKMDRYVKTIYNKANEMDRLINELTLYASIDTNRIHYQFTRLNVADFFEDCAEELCVELEEQNIRFTYENAVARDTRIIADPEQIKRVINNIVGNSVKYMDKPNGTVDLRILDAGDFIQVELEDNGKGIDTRELVNIFDRFYRTDSARTSVENGSGIGLSIVRKIIEDHNGKIWAQSKLGKGTTIIFVIRKYQEA